MRRATDEDSRTADSGRASINLPCGVLAGIRYGPEGDPNSAVQRIDAMCREWIWRRTIAQIQISVRRRGNDFHHNRLPICLK
jgi:hypothetical protein